jgi:hypothetical protein
MPTIEEHKAQYDSNIKVIAAVSGLEPVPKDWLVTMYFYSALHLVEAKLAKMEIPTDVHRDRNFKVKKHLKPISRFYLDLFYASQASRYNCIEMTQEHVDTAKGNLDQIIAGFAPKKRSSQTSRTRGPRSKAPRPKVDSSGQKDATNT